MKKSRILSLCLAAILVFSCTLLSTDGKQTFAASLQERINQATRDKKDALEKLNKDKSEKESALSEKEQLDLEVSLLQSELDEIDAIILETEGQIQEKEDEIARFEQEIEENDADFRARLRSMDESASTGFIEILMASKGLNDFLTNVETIQEISEHDQGIIDTMVTLKRGVEASRAELVVYRDEQTQARALVEDKKGALDSKLAEQAAYIERLNSDIALQEKMYDEAAAQEEKLWAEMQTVLSKNSAAKSSSGGGSAPKYTGGSFAFPAPSMTMVTSYYGSRIHPIFKTRKNHSGMDLAAPSGTDVVAAESGTVRMASWNGGYGYCVIIDHGNGVATLYGHNSRLLVSSGQTVSRGQVIAKIGSTGNSTGPHLHFEVRINGATTDPGPYIGY